MTETMLETTSVVALGSVTDERDAVKAAFQEVRNSFVLLYPPDQWKSIRTTNAIERLHEEFKRKRCEGTLLPGTGSVSEITRGFTGHGEGDGGWRQASSQA